MLGFETEDFPRGLRIECNKMGCFTVLKCKKKRSEPSVSIKRVNPKEQIPTTLPEPQVPTRSLQSAPPSFRTRVKPVQPENKVTSNRARALSAPESLDAAEQDALASDEYDEHEESKNRIGIAKEQRPPGPQPLPLPSPQGGAVLKPTSSFKSANSSGPLYASGPLPLPPSGTYSGTLRNFLYEEILSACCNFSSDRCVSEGLSSIMFRASFGEDTASSKKFEASVIRLNSSPQGLKEFINEVNTLASLQHPNLCKLLGYHARDVSDQRMLVYERLYHGSLDRLLYGRSDGPPIDWNTRMKISLCAAQGLAFLHEEGPFQAMYNEFSTANIQIDKDFSAKLSGYGCVGHIPDTDISNGTVDMKYSSRFPLQEPAAAAGKQMSRSPSLNGIITPAPRLSFSPSPPSRARPSISPTRPRAMPPSLPPRACSSTLSLEELERQESRKSSSSSARRPSVEGF
ncbi:hypothetical protein SADUNF_Sadunf04G0162100 [Salix dunnii]|uniref:Protein kinase domain-containing protein n=1 Tax=Salix dunnii TaxID=1413687 RepID=A0A835K616_9ROSI|nr:hypothetical protein SADUNF_Sadunf04G0162100 [Salix dunnii]